MAIRDDGFPLAPCECGREQASYLNVLLELETMWNRDRVIHNKPRLVKPLYFLIEEIFQRENSLSNQTLTRYSLITDMPSGGGVVITSLLNLG